MIEAIVQADSEQDLGQSLDYGHSTFDMKQAEKSVPDSFYQEPASTTFNQTNWEMVRIPSDANVTTEQSQIKQIV
jgi:hypothetical protein